MNFGKPNTVNYFLFTSKTLSTPYICGIGVKAASILSDLSNHSLYLVFAFPFVTKKNIDKVLFFVILREFLQQLSTGYYSLYRYINVTH